MAGIFDVDLNVAKAIVSDTKEKLTPKEVAKEDKKRFVTNPLDALRLSPFTAPIVRSFENKDKILEAQGKEPKYFPKLKKGEVEFGKEMDKALLTGATLAIKEPLSLLTSGIDYAFDTNTTRSLDRATDKFLKQHGNPETFTGDMLRIGVQYGIPSTVMFKVVGKIPQLKKLGPVVEKYKGWRKYLSSIENKLVRRTLKLGTSIARRAGQSGLALGATDALVAERGRNALFVDKVSEEGLEGRELAVARFTNKLKFGQEGALVGGGFSLAGKALPLAARYGLAKPAGLAIKIGSKIANPFVSGVATVLSKTPGLKPTIGAINATGDFIAKELGTRFLLGTTALGRRGIKEVGFAKLPEFKKWRTFSVSDDRPVRAALKSVDNKLSILRSYGQETSEQYALTSQAKQAVTASARVVEKLLKSIEKRSYNLAKAFEGSYNKAGTSPASQDYYLDAVLSYLKGQKTLVSLPKELQVTAKALNKEVSGIRKTFGELLPEGDLKTAVLQNLKGYMRKSFAIFSNPGYAVSETDPIFKAAQKFALDIVNKNRDLVARAQKFVQNKGEAYVGIKNLAQGKEEVAKDMVRSILRLGKQDGYDPVRVLNEIAKKELRIDKFIATGEEIPAVIQKLLGAENNLKSSVLTTMSGMVGQATNKLMFDKMGDVLVKAGILFKNQDDAIMAGVKNSVPLREARGLGMMQSTLIDPRKPLYGAPDLINILQTFEGPFDFMIKSGFGRNMLQIKTGVQYGKTVLSPETQVRNFFSAGMFPLARGLIGGRASVTDGIKLVVDDIWNAGKGDAKAELRLLENIREGIRVGVLDESIVASELSAVLKEVRNGSLKSIDGLAKFLEKNPITEAAQRMYAGGDNVWKWYTYNWYKSFLKDVFKNDMKLANKWFKDIAGRDLQKTTLNGAKMDIEEAIKLGASWYTRNTVPTYSKVPVFIQALRRSPFGNFVSFPAEMLRTTFNNMNISMREAASDNPQLRAMGYRGLMGLYTTLGGLSYATKELYNSFTGFTPDMMDLYKKYFAPEYMNTGDIVAITKPEKGRFKVVNLSDFIPQAVVTEPIEAAMNKLKEQKLNPKDVTNFLLDMFGSIDGPVGKFLESYISTPIGFEPVIDYAIRGGRTKTGKVIFSSTDKDSQKIIKTFAHIFKTMEPGIVTTSRKFKNSFMNQPTPSGKMRDLSDIVIGASTGIKPQIVDIREDLDYKISQFSRIRTDVYKGENFYKFNDLYNRGGQVIVDEFIDIQEEAFRLQKEIYQALQAAKQLGLSNSDLRKIFKARKGISSQVVRNIMRGRFTPVGFSEPLFQKKIATLKKREKEKGIDFDLSKRYLFPKSGMKRVIRKLKNDKLTEQFYYNRPKEPVTTEPQSSLPSLQQSNVQVSQAPTKPVTPPLPKTPTPVLAAQANPISATGLTNTEMALLSPSEQAIRLRQRG